MFNMFAVPLAPFKSHCYFLKIYFAADTAKSKTEADLLDLISRNRDIVYLHTWPWRNETMNNVEDTPLQDMLSMQLLQVSYRGEHQQP